MLTEESDGSQRGCAAFDSLERLDSSRRQLVAARLEENGLPEQIAGWLRH